MKVSRVLLIIIVIVVIGIVGFAAYVLLVPAPSTPTVWSTATQYPLSVGGTYAVALEQCVNGTSYIYCVGGTDASLTPRNNVYTSSAISRSSTNITSWTTDSNSYTYTVNSQSCVVYSGDIFCVGGSYDTGPDDIAYSYYTSLNNGAVGTWNATTAYPTPVDTLSCVAYSGYIYCVGGNSEASGSASAIDATYNLVWYAPVSSSGIGNWTQTFTYPAVYLPACYTTGGYIYCIGGVDSSGNGVGDVYYAPLSSSGIDRWTQTTSYPMSSVDGQSCVINSGTIYCIGGEIGTQNSFTNAVYYASINSSGIGTWTRTNSSGNFPDSALTNCVLLSGNIYCVGGADASSIGEIPNVYFVSPSSLIV
jgi:hypothetical protein